MCDDNMIVPAIVVVGYNRPGCIERLLNSVCSASYPDNLNITLVVSIDESDKSDEVEQVARTFNWLHGDYEIRRFNKRQGLKNHILQCGDLSEKYGAVIVLEDDLLVAESFYKYTLCAVNYYKENDNIAGTALYSHAWNGYVNFKFDPEKSPYDVYWGQYSITWGQCWTKGQWLKFREWYADIVKKGLRDDERLPKNIYLWGDKSWGKYFVNYIVDTNRYYVIPYDSMSTNFSEVGEHNDKVDTSHQVALLNGIKDTFSFPNKDQALKYDIFFERIFEGENIAGIAGSDICINLNGNKRNTFDKKYMITTGELNYKVVGTFGLSLRPIDANIARNVPGNDIYMYELPYSNVSLENDCFSQARLDYETMGLQWRQIISIGKDLRQAALKRKIGRFLKK